MEITKKLPKPKNEKDLERLFVKVFSKRYFDKYVKPCLKYFDLTYLNIKKINMYVSVPQVFICLIVKPDEKIDVSEILKFEKEMKLKLKKSGYAGTTRNKLIGSRKASEPALMWKSTINSGCYCLLFERFSEG